MATSNAWKELGRYGSVGLDLLLSMAIGYYGGRWIDARLGTHGWITLVGFLGGTAVGFRTLFRAGKTMQRDIERVERAERGEDPWPEQREAGKPPASKEGSCKEDS